MGFQKLTDLLPQIGLVVLSSISEALPLVILEGYAAGVPTVSTDVGSCAQLIYGLDDEDVALGASGAVVGIADPQALAEAALNLLFDPVAWHKAAQAGIARVERYYTHPVMFGRYRAVYDQALAGTAVSADFSSSVTAQCPVQPVQTTDEALEELEGELIDELMQEQSDKPVAAPEVDIKL